MRELIKTVAVVVGVPLGFAAMFVGSARLASHLASFEEPHLEICGNICREHKTRRVHTCKGNGDVPGGAGGGAMLGGTLGLFAGPVGAAIGAVGGAVVGAIGGVSTENKCYDADESYCSREEWHCDPNPKHAEWKARQR